jgi:hypothetical protein
VPAVPDVKAARGAADTARMASQGPKHIRLRWPGRCATCERALDKGVWAWHDAATRTVRCTTCVTGQDSAPVSVPPPTPEPAEVPAAESPDFGTAGAGARRRYEHLRSAREERAREKFGRLGVAVVRLAGDPQHIKAWKTGAEGEERLAARFQKLLDGKGVLLLHDRRIPMSVANIDHIAIGPGGVTVIDAKKVKGRVRVERTGGLFSPRVEKLRVAGRDRTKLVEGVERQMGEVRAALTDLGHGDVPVAAALCFVDPEGLPLLGTLRMREVVMLGPRGAAKLAARPGALTAQQIAAVTEGLARRLPAG